MSRSFKKNAGHGFTGAASEKEEKRQNHRRERAKLRERIHRNTEDPNVNFREVSDNWSMSKDGKVFTPQTVLERWTEHHAWCLQHSGDGRPEEVRKRRAWHRIMGK